MKKKFFLPMLAMIFAVGMAFATAEATVDDYAEKYVEVNGTWHAIQESDLNCGIGNATCLVVFEDDPYRVIYEVHNSPEETDKTTGNGLVNMIPGPAPSN